MDRQPWLDRVNREMTREGVPASVRVRLLAEWKDHLMDLMEEGISMAEIETKMGEPGLIAHSAAVEHRRTSWVGRHPLLVFGLAPVPLLALTFVASVLLVEFGFGGLAYLIYGDLEQLPRPVVVRIVYGLHYTVSFVPFILLSALFTWLFLRSGVRRIWYGVAMVQILFLAASFISVLTISEIPGESTWSMGFAWLSTPLPVFSLAQVAQVMATFLMAMVVFFLDRRRQARRVSWAG